MIRLDGQGEVVGANEIGATVLFALLLSLSLAVGGAAGCQSPLPEAESGPARLYARECGTCHVAYAPHLMKPAMWEMQMGRMALLRRQRGLPPLSRDQEAIILEYLTRHAG